MLIDVMWEIFETTGHVEDYLMYCSCTTNDANEQIAAASSHTHNQTVYQM